MESAIIILQISYNSSVLFISDTHCVGNYSSIYLVLQCSL